MENSKLMQEIEDKSHDMKACLSMINCNISSLERLKNRFQKEWDDMVVLKYKVQELEYKFKEKENETTIPRG